MRPMALRVGLLVVGIAVTGCATTGPPRGVAGPVEWEVTDVGWLESRDGMRSRWSFTIVLREKAGIAIQFERIDRSARGGNIVTGMISSTNFDRRLEANSELRYHGVENWGWTPDSRREFGGAALLGSLTVERRFVGKDPGGQPVVVPITVVVDRSFGRPSRQPRSPEPPLPPVKSLRAEDLKSLAGRWQGFYWTGQFHLPVEALIRENGAVEFGENDPVTDRLRRTFSIRDGRVGWYSGRDTAEFMLHEAGGRRLLVGELRLPSETWSVRLEWVSGEGERPTAPTSALKDPTGIGPAAREAFERYRSDPKHRPFKAFAFAPTSRGWGFAFGFRSVSGATERALSECRKRGTGCEVYALGDTVVAGMPSGEVAAVTARYVEQWGTYASTAGSPATYKGILSTRQEGAPRSLPVTFHVVRGSTEVSGGWASEDGRLSGVFSGPVSDTNQATIRVTQQHPCRAEFTGVATISSDGRTLDGSYTGPDCDGRQLEATFTTTRQQ